MEILFVNGTRCDIIADMTTLAHSAFTNISCAFAISKVQGLVVHLQHYGWLGRKASRFDITINIYDSIGGCCKLLDSSKYFLGSGPSPSDSIITPHMSPRHSAHPSL